MKVVIDTNVFISSFFNPTGNPKKIIDLWKTGEIILCLTKQILEEYIEVLMRMGLDNSDLRELTSLFSKRINICFVTETPEISIITADPKDNMFIECAVAGNSKYIISGDKHLTAIKKFKKIKILTPLEFIQTNTIK